MLALESTMAILKTIPIKRALDDNYCEVEEFRKRRLGPASKLKIRTGVKLVRDFPPGCGIIQNSLGGSKADGERKPFKVLDNVDSEIEKITSSDKVQKVRNFENKEFGRNKPYFASRPAGTVKYWDPNCSKDADAQKSKEIPTVASVSPKDQIRREKINEAMAMFNEVYERLFEENRVKPKGEKIAHWRVTGDAAKIVKKRMKWMDAEKRLGPICGVRVGDKFRFRSQLQMVGLHCQPQSGIDYTKIGGQNLAISIVDSNRYSNERESCDVLYYSGQGGIKFVGSKEVIPEDQKLERGNLALKNSKNVKNLVRVIRKLHEVGKTNEVFVYDGLYIVKHFTQEKEAHGKMVFKFELHRVPGQPQLHKILNC